MRLIDQHSAADYLRDSGRIGANEPVHVRELPGGVSNMVLLVECPALGDALILKQARPQLRTEREWFANVERNWREADVLNICARLIDGHAETATDKRGLQASTPRIVFEDRENYLFAMTAAPVEHHVWKQELLAGRADKEIAAAAGHLLATLHRESWRDGEIEKALGDCTLFDELRVDPYYRALAESQPAARGAVARLIDSLETNRCSLVHADFSPKNLLVFDGGLMMVDFETGHFGNPAFDLGFFLSHLLLKACYHAPDHAPMLELVDAFHSAYNDALIITPGERAELWSWGLQHLGGCGWARLDGKSPVDYMNDERRRQVMRQLCIDILNEQPLTWPQLATMCNRAFDGLKPLESPQAQTGTPS